MREVFDLFRKNRELHDLLGSASSTSDAVGRSAGGNNSSLDEIEGVPRQARLETPVRRSATSLASRDTVGFKPDCNDRLEARRQGRSVTPVPARGRPVEGIRRAIAAGPAHRLPTLPKIGEVTVGPAAPAVIGAPGINLRSRRTGVDCERGGEDRKSEKSCPHHIFLSARRLICVSGKDFRLNVLLSADARDPVRIEAP